MSSNSTIQAKSELEKFKLFYEEVPNAHPVRARLRRNKSKDQ